MEFIEPSGYRVNTPARKGLNISLVVVLIILIVVAVIGVIMIIATARISDAIEDRINPLNSLETSD